MKRIETFFRILLAILIVILVFTVVHKYKLLDNEVQLSVCAYYESVDDTHYVCRV